MIPNVNPVAVTGLRFIFAMAALPFQQYGGMWAYLATLVLLLLGEFADIMDGQIARKHNRVTDFGKLADPLADCTAHLAVYACFLASGWMPPWMLIVITTRELAVAYMRSDLAAQGEVLSARAIGKVKSVFQAVSQCVVVYAFIWHEVGYLPRPTLELVTWMFLFAATAVTAMSFADYGWYWAWKSDSLTWNRRSTVSMAA